MANIYEEKTEGLHALLTRARDDAGATVLIPDLQRPYVWTPDQVSLLMDSLIRGWPFGTLLMWKVGQGDLQNIPHRQFWQVVDRTEEALGKEIGKKDPPASYHMVLDGQQRLQSLLLALGGDSWGFKLEDRDWLLALQTRRPRGRQGRFRHWSKASLCFDLDRFLELHPPGAGLLGIEFRDVLAWVIADPVDGQSKWVKPASYEEALPRSSSAPGRFIRMSRLWDAAGTNPNVKEAKFREILGELFRSEGVDEAKAKNLLEPMGELMTTLRDLKLSKVTYLELLPFDPNIWTEADYNDAIVTIFTRLNTAGRTLTREEITLAWLKVGWDAAQTQGRPAGTCFQDLLDHLGERKLTIQMDDLVSAVSFVWGVSCNGGVLLANRDLLRGSKIKPMATELARRWDGISESILDGMDLVNERSLEFGPTGHYASVNALAVVWSWMYLAIEWKRSRALNVVEKDRFEKKCRETLSAFLDRWLICSQWAGRWAIASQNLVAGYAKNLSDDAKALSACPDLEAAHKVLAARADQLLADLVDDAAVYVNSIVASGRERVSVYKNVLWVWHRLDAVRWAKSRIQLKAGKGKKVSIEVDHVVSAKKWEVIVDKAGVADNPGEEQELLAVANLLGNCSLLEKTFNISKSDKSLASFLEQVHEFKEGQETLKGWGEALAMPGAMLDPDSADFGEVSKSIEVRDKLIRADVVRFVRGEASRHDLQF